MAVISLTPRKAINKAYLKVKPSRTDIERFKSGLIQLIDRTNDVESEEFHKNLVIDFLKKVYYDPRHYINTKGRNDLVIHTGDKAKSPVGVIIETKKPTNKSEMVRPIAARDSHEQMIAKFNVKAFQELVLYYLRERIMLKNLEVKHLIITNIYEWYIFDANLFERLFAQNKKLVRQFEDFEKGRLADIRTDFFYREIAAPFINELKSDLEYTSFNIRDYQRPLRNNDKKDDHKLIALFKLLSPEHLLKLPFINDSNSLDKRFYSELLHIIGLTETKKGSKKLIERHKDGQRNSGSLLEDTIIQLDSRDMINRLDRRSQYGSTHQERLFNVGLELVITWVNRILFLKLLEAQLITYHDLSRNSGNGNDSFAFLNQDKIKSYDDLDSLFFQVLARQHDERNRDVRLLFEKVPYLNSSLFEPTDMEHATLFISNLRDDKPLPILSSTVLKDDRGKKRIGYLTTLEYLFEFLNAYDFSSEGSETIQEENKTLINASVLGLIFEKINGYKDGSFFTPGFITMYMCRETIRKAFIQKMNERIIESGHREWKNMETITDVYNQIGVRIGKDSVNEVINNLKICDPAVGSGHFLVSALNELIALKSELRVLQDKDRKLLRDYFIEVENDELIVTDGDGRLFDYNPNNRESQRVQETLFHEKQTIIENCLFGVDINPNSVKICRLRLWIELLKNAYYKNETELETLPNIDINIKCGNSLVSRFDLDADLKQALRKSKWTIDGYRMAVDTYRNAETKEQKREMEKLISDIKSDFRSEIDRNDPKVRRLQKLSGDLFQLTNQGQLFEMSGKEKATWDKKVGKMTQSIEKLEAEIEEIKANKIYEEAFEWRFEFPEVLDEDGAFAGFDVVIGNPPYIRQEDFKEDKPYLSQHFETATGTADLYVYFVERGMQILQTGGQFIYILPNKWMRARYGANLRKWCRQYSTQSIADFGDLPVFEEATTYPCIWHMSKESPVNNEFMAVNISTLDFEHGLKEYINRNAFKVNQKLLSNDGWNLVDVKVQQLLNKIKHKGIPLGEYVNGKVYRGVLTGLNEAFVIDRDTRDKLIDEDLNSGEIIKPFLAGRDIKRYQPPKSDKFLILFKNGITKKWFGELKEYEAWIALQEKFPAICTHLKVFEKKAKVRYDQGDYWWELRSCDYYEEFEKEKIIYPNICKRPEFVIEEKGQYTNQKCFIIPSADRHLLGVLNSKSMFFLFQNILPKLRGDFYEPSSIYFLKFPIPESKDPAIVELVQKIQFIKAENPNADTSALEAKIDQLVYRLYDLTEEEIELIEESVG